MSRILFIAFDYYAYTDRIEAEMRAQGHSVRRFPIEPEGAINRALRRYAKARHQRALDAHHARIFEAIRGQTFDRVVFLQAHQYSHDNLRALREAQPDAVFTLYNWDSLKTHDYRPQLPFFDRAATFDPVDAAALGIAYLPLFALPEFYEVAANRAAPAHDIYFVGSMHSLARFEAVKRLHDHCKAAGLRLKLYLHCSPPRMLQLLRRGQWLPGMTLRSIGTDGILDMMRASAGVFDFASQQQSGLTMRVFENLAAGMKIIATNPQIAREPFYSPDRILLLENLDFAPVKAFLAEPLHDPRAFEEYSLSNWLRRLLD
ncbi:hypothetical protein [Sphingomonas sp. MS122]|uniref:hypothetical protein n=1 Tax=Sphingomonas sp. MS122 TaxID=3412683 RepID=UPI003C301801